MDIIFLLDNSSNSSNNLFGVSVKIYTSSCANIYKEN